ncbi:MAG: hypothetical protein V1928_01645 [Parcubacteria group bacterium]
MMKIAKIIPYKKLPRGMDYLDYLIPPELADLVKTGSFVRVPFRAGKLLGLVAGFCDKSEFAHLKSVLSVEDSMPCLPEYQIKLLNWFSRYYYCSLSSALKLLLPDKPKKSAALKDKKIETVSYALEKNQQISRLAEQIYCSNEKRYLLFPENIKYKYLFFKDLCGRSLSENKQILILFPQKIKIDEFYRCLDGKQRQAAAILTNEMHSSKNKYYDIWQQILENKKQIIIGARSAIFAPLPNVSMIIVDNAHSSDYKSWDQNPRYNAINVAKKIQEWTGCKLILSSLSPRIEDAYEAKNHQAQSININLKDLSEVEIVNLKEERKSGFTYLSGALLESVEETIRENKKVVLIVNKKGLFSYLYCNDCKKEAECPGCRLPMTVANDKELVCYHCQHRIPIHLTCPYCQSTDLKRLGVGLESIKAEIKKRFSGDLINVVTSQALKNEIWNSVGLLGYVYIDSLAYLSDFNSNFELYSSIKEINSAARSYGDNLRIILQTCFSENIAMKNVNSNYKKFYSEEIENRQAFNYPPFSSLIKLFFQHPDKKVCEKEAENLHRILTQEISGRALAITDPYPHYAMKVRRRYRYQIAIFLPKLSLPEENALLSFVPNHWIIDKDPVFLL